MHSEPLNRNYRLDRMDLKAQRNEYFMLDRILGGFQLKVIGKQISEALFNLGYIKKDVRRIPQEILDAA